MDIEDQLLQGAIDLHAHAYPEFSLRMRNRIQDIEWIELARAAGMQAIVMKSHIFPTVDKVQLVKQTVPGMHVFGGISLNYSVGGLNPLAVEVTGELGGKVVWMPTWSSKNNLSKSQGYLNRMKRYIKTVDQIVPGPEAGIEIIEAGKLKSVVKEIVQIARDHQMIISSGHISIRESLVLVEECNRLRVPFLLAHPLSGSVGASLDEQKEVANRGGYIEHCFITTMPMHGRLEISRIAEAIKEVGFLQTVLSTDGGMTWNPPPPELMRMYIASLLQLGIDEESIRIMIKENPEKILGLHEKDRDEL